MNSFSTIFFFIAISVFSAGCGAAGQKAEDDLKEAVVLLNEGIRWGRLQEVMPRVHPDNAAHFLKMHEKFGKDIQVSDYELINSVYNAEKKTASVAVQITWYQQSRMELHSTVLLQSWERQGQDWIMMTETYQSGEAF
jgi:hypothetical protein